MQNKWEGQGLKYHKNKSKEKELGEAWNEDKAETEKNHESKKRRAAILKNRQNTKIHKKCEINIYIWLYVLESLAQL